MNAFNGNRLPSVARQVRHASAGHAILVPPDVRALRESLCAACEENLSGRCRKCGCGVRA
jgi:hypothetical protein